MLVPMRDLLDKATIEGYGVVAPNVINECTARVCIEAAEELHAPLILDVGYVFHPDLVFLGRMLEEMAVRSSVPIAVNLDHGATYEQVMWALRAGFTSVMIDRSTASFEVNVRDTAEIVKAAHAVQVSVEAELGHVGDGCSYGREACLYTDPIQAVEFVKQTSVDCLAISVGTAHGVYAGKPQLDFKRIREIRQAVDIPLVLHGGSGSGDAYNAVFPKSISAPIILQLLSKRVGRQVNLIWSTIGCSKGLRIWLSIICIFFIRRGKHRKGTVCPLL